MEASRTQVAADGPTDQVKRRDLRRQRRDAVADRRRQLEQAERRRKLLFWGGGAAVLLLGLAALIAWLAWPERSGAASIQTLPNQGQTHIQHGQSHPSYNSKPPTSGWHFADTYAPLAHPWGVNTQPLPDEVQVHDLEHGSVMVQYDCPTACPDVVSKLESIVRSYPSKVIMAPYPGLASTGHPIALTAWTKLEYLDGADEPAIRDFITRYKDKGPEQVPD